MSPLLAAISCRGSPDSWRAETWAGRENSTADPTTMALPKERKRRFHRRSKNGCQICKRRHVRCDEQKPLCTTCLQSGSDCIYPSFGAHEISDTSALSTSVGSSVEARVTAVEPSPRLNHPLSDYVGGSFDDLPETSKRLLQHFSQYATWGQRPVAREMESSMIHRAFANPGHMHMGLMLSACQWAWVTGSMESVRIPYLYHKAGTYQFARAQLQDPAKAPEGDTMLAISALALTEGAVGELEASSRHLRGIRSAMQGGSAEVEQGSFIPLRILKMVGDGLRTGKTGRLVNVPDYQPTFMALLFASIWDVTALPPREAPRYGWWEETDTQAARLWQNHTRELNLNYEISRGFDPNQYVPRILNGDPKSSRTSFIATFFYLCSELGHQYLDVVLIDWLLEQLIDDVSASEENMKSSIWSRSLWLWCIMFGAGLASSGKAVNAVEERQLRKWREVYDDKMRLVSSVLGLDSWHSARAVLAEIIGSIDSEVDRTLEEIWSHAVQRGGQFAYCTIDPTVIELGKND